ncbi:hypothetical protein BB561_001389 [Smittium simulii]|uniref:Uncharacterized protein n=1 Tax=Smittium simulii TaxID=133385 RepID=A0A2T9YUS8_9FUNG|nr:hypothetical protein BB561_001389 [Smittium simulii]
MYSELILVASKGSESVHIFDLSIGTHLGSLNSTPTDTQYGMISPPYINNSISTPPWIMTIPNNNLNGQVYNLNWESHSCKLKFPLPEKLSCIVSSSTGAYIFGGSYSGKIYVWVASSGLLLKAYEAHYGAVTCLTVSADDSVLISGGEDANSHIWLLSRVLDITASESQLPELSLSEHTMPITSIVIGSSGLCNGNFFSGRVRIFTSSKDQSCKCWEISTKNLEKSNNSYFAIGSKLQGDLLTTWLLPSVIRSIAVDQIESKIFCGCQNGIIYRLDMYYSQENEQTTNYYNVGGKNSVIEIALDSLTENSSNPKSDTNLNSIKNSWDSYIFYGHTDSVNSIALSADDKFLVSGSSDGTIKVWDVFSRQCIKTLDDPLKKESKPKPSLNPKISTTVNSGICQVLIRPRFPEMGGNSSYIKMVKGGANVSYGVSLPELDSNKDVLKLNSASNLPQNSTINLPCISILQRTRISCLDHDNLLEHNDSKNIIVASLKNSKNALRSVGAYAGFGIYGKCSDNMQITVAKDLEFSKKVLHEHTNLKTEDSLRDQLSKLYGDVTELSDKYEKLVDLNANMYEFTVSELLRTDKTNGLDNLGLEIENEEKKIDKTKSKKAKKN